MSATDYQEILNYPLKMDADGDTFIINYTRFLHQRHDFDCFVIFCENSTTYRYSQAIEPSLEQVLMQELEKPLTIWSMERDIRFRIYLGDHNLAFVYVSSLSDPLLEVFSETMENLHFSGVLVIFKRNFSETLTSWTLRDFFEWCWIQNFINIALILQNLEDFNEFQVHYYTPFPVLKVYQLQDSKFNDEMDFIVDYITNTHGYVLDTPIFMDPPTVFLVSFLNKPGIYCISS